MNRQYLKYARDEVTDALIYKHFSRMEKKENNQAMLKELGRQEEGHARFWLEVCDGRTIKPNYFIVYIILIMRKTFGLTFTTKFLELHEGGVVAEYKRIRAELPEKFHQGMDAMIADEEEHEKYFINQLVERRIKYIGSIALGLSDAIVEITGVHAGFLGVTGSTLLAGISGVVVGFAASISMGSAAYLQAKHDAETRTPLIAGLITGLSYLFSVICLAAPYFFLHNMLTAFAVSTLIGMALVATFTFYGAVVFDKKFLGEFLEAVGLMLGTAAATFILGTVLGKAFGLQGQRF